MPGAPDGELGIVDHDLSKKRGGVFSVFFLQDRRKEFLQVS